MRLVEALSTIHELPQTLQEVIQRTIRRQILPKGVVLLEEGVVSDDIFFVENGLARSFCMREEQEVTIWLADEGKFLRFLPDYLLRRPSSETIKLVEPATIITIKRTDFDALKEEHRELAVIECHLIEKALVLHMQRIRMLQIPKAKERLETYSQAHPEFYHRVPLRHIATYLGVDPSTLSRLRGDYKRDTMKNV